MNERRETKAPTRAHAGLVYYKSPKYPGNWKPSRRGENFLRCTYQGRDRRIKMEDIHYEE